MHKQQALSNSWTRKVEKSVLQKKIAMHFWEMLNKLKPYLWINNNKILFLFFFFFNILDFF